MLPGEESALSRTEYEAIHFCVTYWFYSSSSLTRNEQVSGSSPLVGSSFSL